MLNWTSRGLVPTIHLARCREGADDLRFATTLYNRAQKQKDIPAAKEALRWLEQVSAQIAVGQSTGPKDFMTDETFRQTCIDHLRKLGDR
jgi:hypothetical protein